MAGCPVLPMPMEGIEFGEHDLHGDAHRWDPAALRGREVTSGVTKKRVRNPLRLRTLAIAGTGGETRTRKGLPPEDFESSASTIPPLRREVSFLLKGHFKVNRILDKTRAGSFDRGGGLWQMKAV